MRSLVAMVVSLVPVCTLAACSEAKDPRILGATDNTTNPVAPGPGTQNDTDVDPPVTPGPAAPDDNDGDGIANVQDNCREVANPDQLDSDGDFHGDACDNCPTVANVMQEPVECINPFGQDDADGDEVVDADDNCASTANFDQTNSDGDLFGDACDNCPLVANDDQANADGDLLGDACDEDLSNEDLCAEGSTTAEALKPNLYFVFDTSGSMESEDYENLGDAVTTAALGPDGVEDTADDLVESFQVGVATYPNGIFGFDSPFVCLSQPRERLDLRESNRTRQLINAVPDDGAGSTPTAAALQGTLDGQLFVLDGELPSTRPAAIVLLTDGEPNECGDQRGAEREAARFATIGVPVYVIAYDISGDALDDANALATAGSTDPANPVRSIEATDADSIAAAFAAIQDDLVSCVFPIEQTGSANFSRLEVLMISSQGTTPLEEGPDGYRLDLAAEVVELVGQACQDFRAIEDGSGRVELRVACESECVPSLEVCDFRDNDCDGMVDEGCVSAPPEVCNGIDDDEDGEVDEGCPGGVI